MEQQIIDNKVESLSSDNSLGDKLSGFNIKKNTDFNWQEIADYVVAYLNKKYKLKVDDLYFHGSRLKGSWKPTSDLDIAVVCYNAPEALCNKRDENIKIPYRGLALDISVDNEGWEGLKGFDGKPWKPSFLQDVDDQGWGFKKSFLIKEAYARRQDDSLPALKRLLLKGYDTAQWHLHENHPEFDICDSYDGNFFSIAKLISNLQYSAPIFEASHVQCLCYLICTSSTNPDLEPVIVDWRGTAETGRTVDRKDKTDRIRDFRDFYQTYSEKLKSIEDNKYLSGQFSEPSAGIYSFDVTLYDETYYNVNAMQEMRDKALEIILEEAKRYGIKVEDAHVAGNAYIVQTQELLSYYEFSPEDLRDIEWTIIHRREQLEELMFEVDNLIDWLSSTQDEINRYLLEFEQSSTSDIQDEVKNKYSSLEKQSKLNVNLARQFFQQESTRGVVEDKILNELQIELIIIYGSLYRSQKFCEDKSLDIRNDAMSDELYEEWEKKYPKDPAFIWSATLTSSDFLIILNQLQRAKTDKEKILAINIALTTAHDMGNVLGEEYENLRAKA